MRVRFRGPSNEHDEMDVEDIMRLISDAGSAYWQRQSGMADLSCVEGPLAGATLAIIVEPGVGVLLRYASPSGEDEYVLTNPLRVHRHETVLVYPGGNEWAVPRSYFIDVQTARALLETFVESGERADGRWVVLGAE